MTSSLESDLNPNARPFYPDIKNNINIPSTYYTHPDASAADLSYMYRNDDKQNTTTIDDHKNNSISDDINDDDNDRVLADCHDPPNAFLPHKYTRIPTPRIISYNVNSYSPNRNDKEGWKRKFRSIKNLNSLALNADVIMTQETRTGKSLLYRHLLRPRWKVFNNPNTDNVLRAGTDIFVSITFLNSFLPPVHEIVVAGHIHALHFSPKEGSVFAVPFTVINVYLPSGNSPETQARRLSMLDKLGNIQTEANHVFAGGDWNMTEHPDDSSSADHFASNTANRAALTNALNRLHLHEIPQTSHTCIRTGGLMTSSRIDRFYISHTVAEQCTMSPRVTLPPHPYLPGSGKNKGPSDHFPILISFSPPNLSKGTRFKIPEWIANLPLLHSRIKSAWEKYKKDHRPKKGGKTWVAFKKVIRLEAKRVMRENKQKASTKAEALTVGMNLYRGLSDGTLDRKDAARMASRHAPLKNIFTRHDTVQQTLDKVNKSRRLLGTTRSKTPPGLIFSGELKILCPTINSTSVF